MILEVFGDINWLTALATLAYTVSAGFLRYAKHSRNSCVSIGTPDRDDV